MTVAELKAALEGLGVENRSGRKADLVARLEEARNTKQRTRSGKLLALYFHQNTSWPYALNCAWLCFRLLGPAPRRHQMSEAETHEMSRNVGS